jgi:hypothetical protein
VNPVLGSSFVNPGAIVGFVAYGLGDGVELQKFQLNIKLWQLMIRALRAARSSWERQEVTTLTEYQGRPVKFESLQVPSG